MTMLDRTHRIEKKSLVQHNQELRNTVRSLKVSAPYVHLTALLLGAVIFFMYHRTIWMKIAYPIRFDYEAAKAPKLVLSVWWSENYLTLPWKDPWFDFIQLVINSISSKDINYYVKTSRLTWMYRRLVGPLGHCGWLQKILSSLWFTHLSVQHSICHYTEFAILADLAHVWE